jgi:leucyl aminopeptidase
MRAEATTAAPADTGADTIVIGLFEGEPIAHDLDGGVLQALVDSGEARPGLRKLAVTHADGKRYVLAGLGKREAFTADVARTAAGAVVTRAREIGTRKLCWELPHHVGDAEAGGFVEGTLLAAYAYRAYKTKPDDGARIEQLALSAHHDVSAAVQRAAILANAANAARDLQHAPANAMTPSRLAERAHELASELGTLTVETMGRAEIEAAGMGAFAGVAQGSHQEPRLITLRYEPEGSDPTHPVLGLVGKAVTFDTGGISIKPGRGMSEMKFDMSGGAAVLEGTGAIARLGLPVRVVAVIGATENMPSGNALKPGDIVTAKTGTTIEIINTDAEGRLVLADCLAHAVEQGAERLVDFATLTGAIVTTFGNTYAGLFSGDDEWAAAVTEAGARAGELVWRLPLHAEYAKAIESRYADVVNAVENRKAGSIVAAEFLKRFTNGVPWAHVDMAGTANDSNRPWAAKGGTGFGVRLIAELATMAPWTSTSPTTTR